MESKHEILQTLSGYVLTAIEHSEVNQLAGSHNQIVAAFWYANLRLKLLANYWLNCEMKDLWIQIYITPKQNIICFWMSLKMHKNQLKMRSQMDQIL